MYQLLIFPFGGNGLEALDCIDDNYEFIGFIDDNPDKQGKHSSGFEIYSRDVLIKFPESKVLAVPGSPSSYIGRNNVISGLNIKIERFAKIIHPAATISKFSNIGYNVLIMAGVVITSNAKIGNHVVILPNSVVHHDTYVKDYSLIGSNVTIAGYSQIGKNCYIGSGSEIINNITIGDNSLIGLGSNVLKNVPDKSIMAGNPAREIHKKI